MARLASLVILAPCKDAKSDMKSDRQLSSLGQPGMVNPSHHPEKLPPRKPAVPAVGWLRPKWRKPLETGVTTLGLCQGRAAVSCKGWEGGQGKANASVK